MVALKGDFECYQNDLKLCRVMGAAQMCPWCQADRDPQAHPWTDCSLKAAWKGTVWGAQCQQDAEGDAVGLCAK